MKILENPSIQLPKFGMDAPCIELCNLLNCLPGLKTYESCCGHCKFPYQVFFRCDSLDTLTRLGRAVDRRYSDGNWEIVLDSGDAHPKNRFWLRSLKPFNNFFEMNESVKGLIENVEYWFNNGFDKYFDSDGEYSDYAKSEEKTILVLGNRHGK